MKSSVLVDESLPDKLAELDVELLAERDLHNPLLLPALIIRDNSAFNKLLEVLGHNRPNRRDVWVDIVKCRSKRLFCCFFCKPAIELLMLFLLTVLFSA